MTLTVNSSGVSISGNRSIATPIGTFSVGASYALPSASDKSVYVILRNRTEGGTGFDHIYRIDTGSDQFTAVVNGTTTIQVTNHQVLIDVTDGTVQTIRFRHAVAAAIPENPQTPAQRWDQYWATLFYHPFALTRWAYDDSTISKWYGIGFVWFLIRLVLAFFCLIIDLVLTLCVLVAGVAYWLFGSVARNIVFGLEALIALLLVGAVGFAILDG
ncbi:MAG TPA: hypothetical protein VG756_14190 [Pseudonocardiaceae bacterium]|nr:hypothetical protein [Pseudonocardiaceae bacterium]